MKRILIFAVALWLYSATFAFAGKIVSYNSSYGQQPRVISGPLLNGSYSYTVKSESNWSVRFDGNCFRLLKSTVRYVRTLSYTYGNLTDDNTSITTSEPEILVEVCP